MCLLYTDRWFNAAQGNSRCLLWEPYGTHKYTLWAENSVRTSQETHYVSATKPNRLMLLKETVAVYCENHTEHTNTLCEQKTQSVPHRKHITSYGDLTLQVGGVSNETVKYGLSSTRLGPESDCSGKAQKQLYEWITDPSSRQRGHST
jgi:hypothetical protein